MLASRDVVDPTQLYGTWYYHSYAMPYEQENWAALFAHIAHGVVTQLKPDTVLDVGCAKGFLVAALRDRDVAAFGVDVSQVAISCAPESVRPFVQVGSLTKPIVGTYDLVTCIEVIEHLDPADSAQAVGHLCACTDAVLLSTTPGDQDEPTHVNVQPSERWAQLFAAHGFYRDFDHDASYIAPWAVLYRRCPKSISDVVVDYEQSHAQLRVLAGEQRVGLAELRRRLAATPSPEEPSGLAELRREVRDLRQAFRAVDEQLGAVLGQMAEASARLARYRGNSERLDAICGSKSWRLAELAGAPLRALRSVIP